MKRFSTLLLAGSALLLALVPNIRAEEPTPEVLIGRVRAVTLSPHFSREEITQALTDASALCQSQGGIANTPA